MEMHLCFYKENVFYLCGLGQNKLNICTQWQLIFYIFQSAINENELMAYIAIKQDNRPDAADIKKEMDKKKNFFIDALQKRGLALCALGRLVRTFKSNSQLSLLSVFSSDN